MSDTQKQHGALYLRVRPQEFEDLLGNDAAVSLLKHKLSEPVETRPHTFLFNGTRGTGKTTTARICASFLEAHPSDIVEFDCSENTGVDDARELKGAMQYLPTGPCKVYILDECHFLSPQAWSALLKISEDTPKYVYLFFCTSVKAKVPAANVSRSLQLEFQPLSSRDATALIRRTLKSEGIELPKDAWAPIIEASEGSSRQILQNVEKVAGALSSEAELGEALALVTGATEDAPGVKELYKALCAGSRATRDALKTLKSMDPEALRRGVGGYATAIWLNTGDEKPLRIMQAMSSGNTYDCGFMGLATMCSMVAEE